MGDNARGTLTLTRPAARPISDRALTRVVVTYFLCLPLSLIVWFVSLGDYRSSFYAVLVSAIAILPPSLLLCSVGAVVCHRRGWTLATWICAAVPAALMGFIAAMITLAVTTSLDGG